MRAAGFGGGQRDVNVFKDLARSDAENAIEGFDQIVPATSTVLAPEVVGEAERCGELFCFDEEPGAVRLPFRGFHVGITCCFFVAETTASLPVLCVVRDLEPAAFLCEAKVTVRVNCAGVNSVFLVQLRKLASGNFTDFVGRLCKPQECGRRMAIQFFISRRNSWAKLGRRIGGISTGAAQEMQKAGSAGATLQVLVLSSDFRGGNYRIYPSAVRVGRF